LSHTAGVPHWLEAPGLDPAEPVNIGERVAVIQRTPLRTAPGAVWHGYGMFTGTFGGHATYYHPGDNPGYLSFAGWIPDQSASIVILANDESVGMVDLLRQLLPML
jgi:hypothetical protein